MARLEFTVEGSQGDAYHVLFERDGSNLNVFCDCKAGLNGLYCKHRFALMDGDVSRLLSDNATDVSRLPKLIAGTDVEAAIADYREAEAAHERANKALKSAKKKLAKAMHR